jgi:2'-5' RNA ligase
MRLFVALDIDPDIRKRISEFRDQMRSLAPDVRWVGPETFHVTLQFLGETDKLDEIRKALEQIRAARVSLTFRGAGFFPNPKSPRVFWVGIESDQNLQQLANTIGAALRHVAAAVARTRAAEIDPLQVCWLCAPSWKAWLRRSSVQ